MSAPGLNWTDPAACKAWLDDIAAHVDDVLDAADDQTLPIGERRLGRNAARELLTEAKGALRSQLAYGRAGLPEHEAWLRVRVSEGVWSGKRIIAFTDAAGQEHRQLHYKQEDVADDAWLRVRLVREDERTAFVRFPYGEEHTVLRVDVEVRP